MSDKKTDNSLSSDADEIIDGNAVKGRRSYSPPQILSVELLEVAAIACNPLGPTLGKSVPAPCSTLGS